MKRPGVHVDFYEQVAVLMADTVVIVALGWLGLRLALNAAGSTILGPGAVWQFFVLWAAAVWAQYSFHAAGANFVRATYFVVGAAGAVVWALAVVVRAFRPRRHEK